MIVELVGGLSVPWVGDEIVVLTEGIVICGVNELAGVCIVALGVASIALKNALRVSCAIDVWTDEIIGVWTDEIVGMLTSRVIVEVIDIVVTVLAGVD